MNPVPNMPVDAGIAFFLPGKGIAIAKSPFTCYIHMVVFGPVGGTSVVADLKPLAVICRMLTGLFIQHKSFITVAG